MPQCHSGNHEKSPQWPEMCRAMAMKKPSTELNWLVYSTFSRRQEMDRFSAVSTRKAARLDVARFVTRCMAVEDLTLALDIKPRPRLRGGRIAAPCHPADARASPWSAGQWLA